MIFRNTLYVSMLLIVGFLCLHFHEEAVQQEWKAHQYVMEGIVDHQKEYVEIISYSYPCIEHKGTDLKFSKELKADFDAFSTAMSPSDQLSKSKVNSLLEKYEVEDKEWKDGKLSLMTQNEFYGQLKERFIQLNMKTSERERIRNASNLDVVLADRKDSYTIGEDYVLNFEVVDLGKYLLERSYGSYKVGNEEHVIRKFPIELETEPDSITFFLKGTNQVTGEKYKLKEIHHFNQNDLP